MATVKIDPKLLNRFEVLEAKLHTARALAEEMGVDERTLRRWKKGETLIPLTAVKLLECLEDRYLKRRNI